VAPMFQPQNLEPARYSTICRVTRRSTGSIASPLKLTTQMLATLFDFPWEERRKLTRWSDVATAAPGDRAVIASEAARMAELEECGAYFAELWKERINQPPKIDLIF
jgi:cytochrome P450